MSAIYIEVNGINLNVYYTMVPGEKPNYYGHPDLWSEGTPPELTIGYIEHEGADITPILCDESLKLIEEAVYDALLKGK